MFIYAADNGFNPVWNEICEFDVINPHFALLRFVIQDEDMFGDSNSIGQATYAVSIKFQRRGYGMRNRVGLDCSWLIFIGNSTVHSHPISRNVQQNYPCALASYH